MVVVDHALSVAAWVLADVVYAGLPVLDQLYNIAAKFPQVFHRFKDLL